MNSNSSNKSKAKSFLSKDFLRHIYLKKRFSSAEISNQLNCSTNKVNYWLKKHAILKRSISSAVYAKRNPNGDPFKVKIPKNRLEALLFGIGVGLYWGEGTKSNKSSIRLGNTNPRLIVKFIEFLKTFYEIEDKKLRFGLQVFNDVSPAKALNFWKKLLNARADQFQNVVVSKVRGEGTYTHKSEYGVLTIYYNNKKLRDILCHEIEKL